MSPSVSPAELARIERFVAAYNRIDDFLQAQMPSPSTFRGALDHFASRHPFYRDAETLRVFAALRNFLIHEKTRPFDYPCVPGEAATLEIERIAENLTHPATIGEAFRREVVILRPDAPLQSALEHMEKRAISRFPIVEGRRIVGLLTESGIARHLAQITARGARFEAGIAVGQLLQRQTKRPNFAFAPPTSPVSQVAGWFHERLWLEAVLIAETEGETPLVGIVTRGDVAGIS